MASSVLVMRTSLDFDDTIYSYNESPTHHFIKEEPNDADSDETPYSSDKEAAPKLFEMSFMKSTVQLLTLELWLKWCNIMLRISLNHMFLFRILLLKLDLNVICILSF
ncbi:uncharacterized protein G2W53_004433 [Senna tora]|uniref:Uncharacterized protein n=1 Tax=Senna tora TaxID=362788 RepID=A0A834XCV2_9FABA|nr:uncharacterized protein G2W53_004433 [Senna tora]